MKTRLVVLASVCGFASAPAALAFDYFTSTDTIPLQTTQWSLNHTLQGLASYGGPHTLSDLTSILITWSFNDISTYAYDNDNAGTAAVVKDGGGVIISGGFTVNYNLAAALTLSIPGAAVQNGSLSQSAAKIVGPDDGDGFGGPGAGHFHFQFTADDGFTDSLSASQTSIYSVPSGNFSLFTGATFVVPASADSTSDFTTGTGVEDSLRTNQAGSTVSVTFVFVPEANPLPVVVPALLLGAGLVVFRRNRIRRTVVD